jgi:23S rRNA pseudouridine1911/1915/1917 synthase
LDSRPTDSPLLTFSVSPASVGERLDAFLASQIEGWSRARLQRLIEEADVLVNGHVAKSSHKLRENDQVEVELSPSPSTSFTPENIPLDVVFEDDELIVVNKPSGMVVHPAAGAETATLANALAYHFAQLSNNAGQARPGIVHRLDKGTSGLLVVAKTESAHEDLADQFRAREVFKSYVTLVHGQVENGTGEIDQPIARDPRNRIRMAVVRGGRPALSIYRVRKRFERFTLLDVELKTGRTHQIRVHLAWLKHPVVGDEVYGGGRDKTVPDVRIRVQIGKLGRQFLHAEQLGFRHPRTEEQVRFTVEPTANLRHLLDDLK